MSLRLRLLLGLLGLTAVGMAVLAVVSYSALQSYLRDRLDSQVRSATFPALRVLADKTAGKVAGKGGDRLFIGLGPDARLSKLPKDARRMVEFRLRNRDPLVPGDQGAGGEDAAAQLPPGTYGELRTGSGRAVVHTVFTYGDKDLPRPQVIGATAPLPDPGQLFDLPAASGGGPGFRATTLPIPGTQATVLVAVPLSELQQTLSRLRVIYVIVSLAVLAGLGLLSWWVIRIGLRPLREMESTADAIASGDLSQRVEAASPKTEVGRLGGALNEMLRQIEEAFDERRASEEALRTFLADASHELRTPLASIRGYAEVFRMGAAAEPAKLETAMRRIEGESARMGAIVEDLLTLARLDHPEPRARGPVDLALLAAEACEDARAAAPGHPVEFCAEREVEVMGDAGELRQVAGNLVANATLHTPPGTPVEVRLYIEGRDAVLEVTDAGPGIPPGEEERIFERFHRLPGRSGHGTGLGLAIVHGVVAAHGGRVVAGNAPGGGSRFTVRLPAHATSSVLMV